MSNPFMPQQPAGNPFAPAPAPQQQPNPYQQQPAPQQYAPAPAPQYTQQPQQYATAPAPAAAPVPVATAGGFMAPPPPKDGGSSNMPRVADLQSRLLLIMPESVERNVPGAKAEYTPTDRMHCTVVVLDGGPLQWGGLTPNSQRMTEQVPYVIKDLHIRQSKLVGQLEDALALRLQGGPGLMLGRLWKTGPGQNDPYVLATPSPDDARLYDQYISQVNPFSL